MCGRLVCAVGCVCARREGGELALALSRWVQSQTPSSGSAASELTDRIKRLTTLR